MAYSSIKGPYLGYDSTSGRVNAPYGGFAGTVTTVTSGSTATTIANHGTALVTSISTQTFTLAAPAPGVRKVLLLNSTSTSTAARTITLASGNFQTTASATYTSFAWIAAGGSVVLEGQSTSRYHVLTNNAATLS